jgi:glycosyltransferase involved in cell wall biosynthesis
MRICFIALGKFTHIGAYLDYFRMTGHDVHFVSLSPSPERNVPVYNLGLGKKYSSTKGKWKYPLSMLRARFLIKKLKPDIIHAHYATSCGLTALISGFHPFVVTAHGSDVATSIRSPVWRPLLKTIFRHADCVNAVSDELRNMIISLGIPPEKIETLTLGIDTRQFTFCERPVISRSRALRLICTRRLEQVYDHPTIIKALRVLTDNNIDFAMTFVGDGIQRQALEQLAADESVNNKVTFMGAVENDKLPNILNRHDIYLSASHRDGTSLCLLEAMAAGVYPVVSDINANTAWLKHGVNGFLHKVSDHEDLARCIISLFDNPELITRAVQNNRQIVIAKGDRRTNMHYIETIYERLIQK